MHQPNAGGGPKPHHPSRVRGPVSDGVTGGTMSQMPKDGQGGIQ